MGIQFNSDTGTNYSRTYLNGNGSTASSAAETSQDQIYIGYLTTGTIPSLTTVDIFSYTGSTYKTILSTSSTDKNGSGNILEIVGLWRSTSAITSIVIRSDATTMNTGTTATLYGIKAA